MPDDDETVEPTSDHAGGVEPAEEELRSLEASFAAVEEAMESLTRITADGGDGAVVVAQIEAVVNPARFPVAVDTPVTGDADSPAHPLD